MSEAWSYCLSTRETSGARYHLEPTCIETHLLIFFLLFLSSTKCWLILSFNYYWLLTLLFPWSYRKCSLIAIELEFSIFMQVWGKLLDNPKSHILALQSDVIRMLADLRSLCITLASCIKANEQSALYINFLRWPSLNSIWFLRSWSRSDSMYSITMQMWFISIDYALFSVLIWKPSLVSWVELVVILLTPLLCFPFESEDWDGKDIMSMSSGKNKPTPPCGSPVWPI